MQHQQSDCNNQHSTLEFDCAAQTYKRRQTPYNHTEMLHVC
jgi:hypothetical protein